METQILRPTLHLLNQKWAWGDCHVCLNKPFRKCWQRLPQWVLPDSLVCKTRATTTLPPAPVRIQPRSASPGLI